MFFCMCVHACVVALVVCCQAGIIVLVMMALSPSTRRPLCCYCDDNVALVTMVLLLSSLHRHLCHCQTSAVALIAYRQAGVVALVVMALWFTYYLHKVRTFCWIPQRWVDT
jgi:hypothetical protein